MANRPVFLDTGGLLALVNEDDALHAIARKRFQEFDPSQPFVTTNLVLAEVGNSLARKKTRQKGALLVRELLDDPLCETIFTGRPLFVASLNNYVRFGDKTWGLVDCISFEVMRQRGLDDAFTVDRHFEQAGFRCLLRSA